MFAGNLSHRDRKQNPQAISEQNMVVMANDGPSPHSPSLRLGIPAPQPSRQHHAQSLWAPHLMTQERIMFSNTTQNCTSLPSR